MKYWIPDHWSDDFNHEGLLFFVQKVQEMLFHFSSDIHRVPVHNTKSLIYEFFTTYEEVESGAVKVYQLTPIFEEIRHSFSTDKVLVDNLGDEFVVAMSKQLTKCPESNYHNLINYISGIISPHYLEWTVSYLKTHISQGNHKTEIEQGIRSWLPELIMGGYSAEYVYNSVENLAKSVISSLEDLNTFFGKFDFEKKIYRVYFQISDSMNVYAEILHKRLYLNFEDDGNFCLINKKRRHMLCYFEIEALDYYQAISHAYHKINFFFRYYRFISNKRNYLLYKFGAVFECDSEQMYYLPILPTGFKSIEMPQEDVSPDLIDWTILGLQEHRRDDMDRLNKAIELHNSALQQQLPEDGFINLWSALEVLCPQENYGSKIDSILYAALPILQNDYFTIVFESIFYDLKDNLSEQDFANLMGKIELTNDWEKIMAFCLLPEYEQLREDAFRLLKDIPMIRHKIYSLYIMRKDKKALFGLSTMYCLRVKWHFYRLYRARNAIVHTGTKPQHIRILGEHLHSYVDSIMMDIAGKLVGYPALPNIHSIFVDINLLINSKKTCFSTTEAVTLDDIKTLHSLVFTDKIQDIQRLMSDE